jgi:hypothetical protein
MARVPLNEIILRATSPATLAQGVAVHVYERGTEIETEIFSAESGGVALAQPLASDSDGRIRGDGELAWLEEGSYDLSVNGETIPWEAAKGDSARIAVNRVGADLDTPRLDAEINLWIAEGQPENATKADLVIDTTGLTVADIVGLEAELEAFAVLPAAVSAEEARAKAAEATAKGVADAALPKAGGTMTGKIVLDGDPTANLHPATKQFVIAQITALINGAPGTLDTLKEIATQLESDESVAVALATSVAGKASKTELTAEETRAKEAEALAKLGLSAPIVYSKEGGAGSAKGLRRHYEGISNALNAQYFVDFAGDSHVAGQGANNSNTFTAADNLEDKDMSAAGQLRQLMQKSEAGGGISAGEGFIHTGYSLEGRIELVNAPSTSKNWTAPLRRGIRLLNGTTNAVKVTIPAGVTKLGVIQANQAKAFNSAGTNLADVSARWKKNGVEQGNVTALTNTGVPILARLTVAAGDVIEIYQPATAQTYIGGEVFFESEKGIILNRIGITGETSGGLIGGTSEGLPVNAAESDQNLAIDTIGAWHSSGLLITEFLSNDQALQGGGGEARQNKVTAPRYKEYVEKACIRYVANGGCVLLVGNIRNPNAAAGESEATYIAKLKEIALAMDHVAFVDMGEVFGTAAQMQAAGHQFTSSVHMKQAAHAIYARRLWHVLNPSGQYGYQAA